MKVGDLVKFETGFLHWKKDYSERNPGIVVDIIFKSQTTAVTVMWSNGDKTTEHGSFLRAINV